MNPRKDLSYTSLSSAKFELAEAPFLGNLIWKKERKGTIDKRRGAETNSGKRRMVGRKDPYPKSKRGASSIQDVPNLLLTEGNGISAIPNKLYIETKQVLQQCKQDGHDQGVGNVQILERMVRESRNQMITLSEGGGEIAAVCKSGRQTEGRGKMACILGEYLGMYAESYY